MFLASGGGRAACAGHEMRHRYKLALRLAWGENIANRPARHRAEPGHGLSLKKRPPLSATMRAMAFFGSAANFCEPTHCRVASRDCNVPGGRLQSILMRACNDNTSLH